MTKERTYKSAFFKITAKSNLHVGSGNNDYGIIDNLIQRDHITTLPIINSSSLKGALRAFCEYKGVVDVDSIFGTKMRDPENDSNTKNAKEQQAGKFRFFDAKLLAMPIQSDKSDKMFEMITCADIKEDLKATSELFNGDIQTDSLFTGITVDATIKDKASDYELPVIARNQLDNGESKNLWYEQVMPRESQFYFVILYPNDMTDEFNKLKEAIEAEPLQIGANASIGYGFCKIEEIKNRNK